METISRQLVTIQLLILKIGVCLSHAAVLDAMVQLNAILSNDVLLCFSSLYWIRLFKPINFIVTIFNISRLFFHYKFFCSGLVVLLKGTICGATRIITTDTYSPELQLGLYEKYKVSWSLCAPHHLVLMMKSDKFAETDISSIRVQAVAGAKVPLHVQTEMSSHLPNGNVHVFYGMSETCGVISADYPGSSGKACVGHLLAGVKAKIVNDDGNQCGPNVDGEICIKENYKFIGYYGNQEATDELLDDDGFIKTGDIGHFDDGILLLWLYFYHLFTFILFLVDGYLYLIDRKKDLMKYCGFQISPSEIDAYLIESSDIKSACVVGIPDELGSDLPAAVIVRADGSNISGQEIYDMVAGNFTRNFYNFNLIVLQIFIVLIQFGQIRFLFTQNMK